jgi:hypothetical protein
MDFMVKRIYHLGVPDRGLDFVRKPVLGQPDPLGKKVAYLGIRQQGGPNDENFFGRPDFLELGRFRLSGEEGTTTLRYGAIRGTAE